MNKQIDLLLASQSPRRSELLQQIGVRFACVKVDVPEQLAAGESPPQYIQRLALSKARAAGGHHPQKVVLGADTVVVQAGEVLEKPRNKSHGLQMLASLSGNTHSVLTAVALVQGDREAMVLVSSEVTFRAIDPLEAERYWATGEPQDKAGGYGIQGFGGVFVTHLVGSYSNVVGLPLAETQGLLQQFEIPVWTKGNACE